MAGVARIRAHMVMEGKGGKAVTRLSQVPVSAGDISREWLTQALCGKVPGAGIVDFEMGAPDMATTARSKIEIRYNDAGQAAGLPQHIFAKATPEFSSRFVCGLSGSLERETKFYSDIQRHLDIETPVCFYANYHPGSYRSIFLFEDTAIARGATFLSPTFQPSRAQAEKIVRTLARLHSRLWGDARLERDFYWLSDPLSYQFKLNDLIGFGDRCMIGMARSVPLMPAKLAARKDEIWPAFMNSCKVRSQHPRTLIHTDAHIGNWYILSEEMGLCDWQTTMKGNWATDFAYALTSSLNVDDRRALERDLLALYLDTLDLPPGQVAPTFDQAWTSYRQQVLHGLFNWFFVAGIGEGQTAMHSDAFWKTNLTRMLTAVDDLDTLDSLVV